MSQTVLSRSKGHCRCSSHSRRRLSACLTNGICHVQFRSPTLSCPTTCQAPVLRQCDGGTSLKHSPAGRLFLSQGGYRGGISIPFHSRAMPELSSQSSCQKLRSAWRGSWNPPKFLDLRKETEPASRHSKSLHVSRIWEVGKFPFVSKGGTVTFCWYVRSDWPATRRGVFRPTAISNYRFLGP